MNYDLIIYKPDDGSQGIFYASGAQRQSARGREGDLLFAQLSPSNLPLMDIEALLGTLEAQAKLFYKASGSVTKAMRGLVDGLNKYFHQQNSNFDTAETWQTAALSLGVIHFDTLFMAQIGQSSTHVIRAEADELFFDPDLDRRGLGASLVVTPRYFQTSLKGNEALLFMPDPVSTATSNMTDEPTEQIGSALAYLTLKPGSGKISYRPLNEYQPTITPEENLINEGIGEAVVEAEVVDEEIDWSEAETIPYQPSLAEDLFTQAVLLPDEPEGQELEDGLELEEIEDESEPEVELEQTTPSRFEETVDQEKSNLPETKTVRAGPDLGQMKEKALHGVATGASWLRRAEEKAEAVVSAGKAMPEQKMGLTSELSPWAKILIAVIVPLILVAVTSLIYFNRGEGHQYDYYLTQAQAAIGNAPLMPTTQDQQKVWNEALGWLDEAAKYQDSAEVRSLRSQAQSALDALEGALRLQYVPAYASALYPNMRIKAIVSLNNDLYLLDSASGSVLYMRLRNTGYELDEDFRCGPGSFGGVEVGHLVDMTSIPLNNPSKAPILAVDGSGNLLYCSPTGSPVAVALSAPEIGWAQLQSFIFDSNRLYILDPANNALWYYRGLAADFAGEPKPYFTENELDLTDVIDFEVEGEDLFVLYADGLSAHCLSSAITGITACDDPYPYRNTEGVEAELETAKNSFHRLAYSQPPDPSVYYLEASQGSLYQFSKQMNLHKVLKMGIRDGSAPVGAADAFYISPDRRVFLAFGNQLYHAVLP